MGFGSSILPHPHKLGVRRSAGLRLVRHRARCFRAPRQWSDSLTQPRWRRRRKGPGMIGRWRARPPLPAGRPLRFRWSIGSPPCLAGASQRSQVGSAPPLSGSQAPGPSADRSDQAARLPRWRKRRRRSREPLPTSLPKASVPSATPQKIQRKTSQFARRLYPTPLTARRNGRDHQRTFGDNVTAVTDRIIATKRRLRNRCWAQGFWRLRYSAEITSPQLSVSERSSL